MSTSTSLFSVPMKPAPSIAPLRGFRRRQPNVVRVCFDTSSLNRILDVGLFGPTSGFRLPARIEFWPSAPVIIQAGATKRVDRRRDLLRMCAQLAGNRIPLAPPREFLEAVASAVMAGQTTVLASASPDLPGFAHAIRNPGFIGEVEREDFYQYGVKAKAQFVDMHDKARAHVDSLLGMGHHRPVGTREAHLRDVVVATSTWVDFAAALGASMFDSTHSEVAAFLGRRENMQSLLDGTLWQIFIATLSLSIFDNVWDVQLTKDGDVPDMPDILQALYLPSCDVFLTEDRRQGDHLNAVATSLGIESSVMNVVEFRSRFR